MAFRITEYGGHGSGPFTIGARHPVGYGLIQTQVITVGSSVSTSQLSSATRFVEVDTDTGCYLAFGSSVSTNTAGAGSSNVAGIGSTGGGGFSQRIPANTAPMGFYVQPFMKLFVLST
jgi:hypothetical protein